MPLLGVAMTLGGFVWVWVLLNSCMIVSKVKVLDWNWRGTLINHEVD